MLSKHARGKKRAEVFLCSLWVIHERIFLRPRLFNDQNMLASILVLKWWMLHCRFLLSSVQQEREEKNKNCIKIVPSKRLTKPWAERELICCINTTLGWMSLDGKTAQLLSGFSSFFLRSRDKSLCSFRIFVMNVNGGLMTLEA